MTAPAHLHNISNEKIIDAIFLGMTFLLCSHMLTSLIVSMFLCCNFWPVCSLMVDFSNIGLYNMFPFMLARLHPGKCNLNFVVVWYFSL